MTDDAAMFRVLTGIGPTTEAELHEAGVRTWSSLAAVVTALLRVKGVASDPLRTCGTRPGAGRRRPPGLRRPAPPPRPRTSDGGDQPALARTTGAVGRAADEANAGTYEHHLILDAGRLVGGRRIRWT